MKKLIGVLILLLFIQSFQFAQTSNDYELKEAYTYIKNKSYVKDRNAFNCLIYFDYGALEIGDSISISVLKINGHSYGFNDTVTWNNTGVFLKGANNSDIKASYFGLDENDVIRIESDTLKTDFPTNVQVNVFRSRGGVELNNITIYFDENGIGYERILGVSNKSESDLVKFYPNPVYNYLNYSNEIKIIQIVDSKGKTVPFVLVNNQIDVSMLHIGEYIVQYEYDDQIFTKTFIKE